MSSMWEKTEIQKRKKMLFQVIIPGDLFMRNWNHLGRELAMNFLIK